MIKKKILYLFSIFYVLFFSFTSNAEEITEINRALNNTNIMTKDEYNEQVIETANIINADNTIVTATKNKYPAKYDPRIAGEITSVKNQEPYGTCWAYAPVAAAESALIKQGFADNTIDLSELQYAYTYWKKEHSDYDYEIAFNFGSTLLTVWEYMSQGIGPDFENNFGSVIDYDGKDFSDELLYSHIYDLDYIEYDGYTSAAKTSSLKAIISKYGGAAISYYSGNAKYYLSNPVSATDDEYNNTGDSTYYNPHNITIINHAVEVVGWDDNYPKENFSNTPPGNGAWLIKGSWGENYKADFDENLDTYLENNNKQCAEATGYYWISYYESSIMNVAGIGAAFTTPDTKTKRISVPEDEITITAGDKYTIDATVLPETATNKTLKYTSSDITTAYVNKDGIIVGIREGTATITISNSGGIIYNPDETDGTVTKEIKVTVRPISLFPVVEDKTDETLTEDKSTEEKDIEPISEEKTTEEKSKEDSTENQTEEIIIIPEKTEDTTEEDALKSTKEEVLPDKQFTINDTIDNELEKQTDEIHTGINEIINITEDNSKKLDIGKCYIKSLNRYKKKRIYLTYKKITGANLYEIQISKKKNFKKKIVFKTKKSKYKSKKLKPAKYYIRVRGLYKDDGLIVYGKWSKVKKIKIK